MAQMTMIQAITDALRVEMKNDPNVLVFGEDVGVNGGVFRATEGLQAEFGEDRVMDTPLAESGIGGLAVGLALEGFRPVPEIQFFGFVYEVMDSISGQLARMRYRSGGRWTAPVTVRSPFGGGVHTPELHADSLEGLVAQQPGLKVVIPSTPYDAKGLLISAIRDNDPVIYLEHMKLYRSFRQDVPEGEYTIDLGKADIKREGTDVSVIAYGAMVHAALKAAEELEKKVSLQRLLTYVQFNHQISKQSSLLLKNRPRSCSSRSSKQAGIAANVVAEINDRAILNLEAPVVRVAAADTVFPFSQAESVWLPNHKDIVEAVNKVMNF